MTKSKKKSFEKNYFTGKSGTYSKCYEHKASNISLVYQERALPILSRNVSPQAKILDVACAFGDLLSLLDNDKYITYGIDISRYAIKEAKKHTQANLTVGDLNNRLPYKNNFFDAVFAFDIIEHLESPYKFLLELRRVLKKNGLLLIQTPNINSFFEKFYKKNWFGYQDETHLNFFTRKSLTFLLKKVGFSIIVNETFSQPFPKVIRSMVKNTDIGGNLWIVAKKI